MDVARHHRSRLPLLQRGELGGDFGWARHESPCEVGTTACRLPGPAHPNLDKRDDSLRMKGVADRLLRPRLIGSAAHSLKHIEREVEQLVHPICDPKRVRRRTE